MKVLPVGPDALLVEVDGVGEALDLAAWVRRAGLDVVEVVPGAGTVLLDGIGSPGAAAPLAARLGEWRPSGEVATGEPVEIAVVYDGADLDDVARAWGTDRAGVVARHTGTAFTAAFCGFAPGFAYLAGLPDELAVPRLDTPRSRVPAGAVALAGTWAGVYPTASPGGWRLLGRTDAVLWDADRPHPALLAPGTPVRFVEA